MTGESLYPRDLIERLRDVLAERERRIDRRERDAELRAEPRERWEQHHYAAEERLERLRTIQAHRKILDAYVSAVEREEHWKAAKIEKFIAWSDHEVTALRVAVDALASIYFPESDGESP